MRDNPSGTGPTPRILTVETAAAESSLRIIRASRSAVDVQLLRVVRLVIRVDSDPARRALFAKLVQTHRPVRLAFNSTNASPARGRRPCSSRVTGSRRSSASRGLAPGARACSWWRRMPTRDNRWHESPGGSAPRIAPGSERDRGAPDAIGVSGTALLLSRRRVVEALRIIRWLDRRYGFLVSCRAAGAIAWYARSRAILAAARPAAILVSSDSNPEEVGFVARGARARRFRRCSSPTPIRRRCRRRSTSACRFSKAKAAVDARRRKGPIKGAVLLAGVEGDSAPLDAPRFARPDPVIGIFTPKALSWPTLAAIVDDCRDHFHARQIVIRWHPSMLEPPRLGQLLDDRSRHRRVAAAAAAAGRGAAVRLGDRRREQQRAPAGAEAGHPDGRRARASGVYPASRSDQYGFVGQRRRVSAGGIDPRSRTPRPLSRSSPTGWPTRFEQYDASYLRPPDAIGGEVRRAIRGAGRAALRRAGHVT